MSVIDMFISAPHSQIHTWLLEIYHTRGQAAHAAAARARQLCGYVFLVLLQPPNLNFQQRIVENIGQGLDG